MFLRPEIPKRGQGETTKQIQSDNVGQLPLEAQSCVGPSGRRQRALERLFVTEAEDPGLFGLNELTLGWGEKRSAAKEGRKTAACIQPSEGLCVYPHLGTVGYFAFSLALTDLSLEQ